MSLVSWGNYPKVENTSYLFKDDNTLQNILSRDEQYIPYGNGRSYGDSALNSHILCMKPKNYFLDFNEKTGILHCEAGVLLAEILNIFVPRGWFLSITPGTKLITVGGAIASDVHGKNHHVAGTFSNSVVDFKLMLPNGETIICSEQENNDFYRATCGGMGLTGVILEARIRLKKITSYKIEQVSVKTKSLKETFEAFETYKNYSYSVAWIDCLARGEKRGRAVLTVGEHAADNDLAYQSKVLLKIPFNFPSVTLNTLSVKSFNMIYYQKATKGISKSKVGIDTFFYPLDAIDQWNRIYGKNGFTQYQFVLPMETSYTGLEKILSKIAESGKGTFLAVLKLFGKENNNWLSFPMEGYTLALDFKIEPSLFPLLDKLDRIVLDYGGRFYLSKDTRISKETFEKGYPRINTFREFRKRHGLNKKFKSLQSIRVDI